MIWNPASDFENSNWRRKKQIARLIFVFLPAAATPSHCWGPSVCSSRLAFRPPPPIPGHPRLTRDFWPAGGQRWPTDSHSVWPDATAPQRLSRDANVNVKGKKYDSLKVRSLFFDWPAFWQEEALLKCRPDATYLPLSKAGQTVDSQHTLNWPELRLNGNVLSFHINAKLTVCIRYLSNKGRIFVR